VGFEGIINLCPLRALCQKVFPASLNFSPEVAVCGSHGKTTTTSMIAHVMHEAGYDPTVIVGGILKRFGSNAKLGKDNLILSLRQMKATVPF
jgi:UDP-N-acetylmuramate-alanine ligase